MKILKEIKTFAVDQKVMLISLSMSLMLSSLFQLEFLLDGWKAYNTPLLLGQIIFLTLVIKNILSKYSVIE